MRNELLSLGALLVLSSCEQGMTADVKLKGELAGRPTDLSFTINSGGGGMSDGTNYGDDRNIANQLAIIGGIPAYTAMRTTTCPTEPCPDTAELLLWTPPPIIYAGLWPLPERSHLALQKDLDPLLTTDISGQVALDFGEPQFVSGGRVTMRQPGTFAPGAVRSSFTLEGSFSLEYQCHKQSKYFRHCGEAIAGDGQTNPLKLPYARDTCPRELVAPYEASPKWSGNTVTLGDLKVDCRETEGSLNGGKPPVLCYSKRTGVSAGGCTWTVHFLTDGAIYQFAIAAFADAACPVKTCNTWR